MKKILIADDELGVRAALRIALHSDRYEILEAADGWETMTVIREHHPEVVVLDIMMPGLDGLSICRALKGNPETTDIVVVMLTARTSVANMSEGYQAGADYYVTKPFSPPELRALVEDALGVSEAAPVSAESVSD